MSDLRDTLEEWEGLSFTQREVRVWDLFRAGKTVVPQVWKPVHTTFGPFRGTFYVSPNYFAIGSASESVLMPLSQDLTKKIADFSGWTVPTAQMVDTIWQQSDIRLEPMPWGPPYTEPEMSSIGRIVAHNDRISVQLRAFSSYSPSSLVAGHKKDVVLAKRCPPNRVAIYGWHKLDGKPIQGQNTWSHGNDYGDYSHGSRFVLSWMEVNGDRVRLSDVLRDNQMSGLLSREGSFANVEVPMLVLGTRSAEVATWQKYMNAKGFKGANGSPLVVDGSFGANSAHATKMYQQAHGLPVTGTVGDELFKAAVAYASQELTPTTVPDLKVYATPITLPVFRTPAKYFERGRRGKRIRLGVLHSTECGETPNADRNVASYFKDPRDRFGKPVVASAHEVVDYDSVTICVEDGDTAYHAGAVNYYSKGFEMCGYAKQTAAEWSDPYSEAVINNTALRVALMCYTHKVEPVFIESVADLKRLHTDENMTGITTHVAVSKALGGSHWDPGPNFPIQRFMAKLKEWLKVIPTDTTFAYKVENKTNGQGNNT